MEGFSSELKNICITLNSNVDAVRFSFIVRNSISYLNLHTVEYSDINNRSRLVYDVANDFVCTEEKCRKILAPNRKILYNLNLDLPVRRECRLKNDIAVSFYSRNHRYPHIAKIILYRGLDPRNMSNLIEDAIKVTDKKLKILAMLVKSSVLKKEILGCLMPPVVYNFIDCFYPKISDSVLFKGFLETLNFSMWMRTYEEPAILGHLLYHARLHGISLNEEEYPMCERIDDCIFDGFFLNIKPILKYTDAPEFSPNAYIEYFEEISELKPNFTEEVLDNAEKCLREQRLYWILQLLWIYFESSRLQCIEAASEALRLLWNSCPVACITFGEMEKVFRGALTNKELTDVHEFYCDSIDEYHSAVEPRFLKHLCRTTIRRILKKNCWIPDHVKLTGLPTSLQAYLNLE